MLCSYRLKLAILTVSENEKLVNTALCRYQVTSGLVERQVYIEMPLRVEYSLTPHGKTLFPVLAAMAKWGYENYPEQFSPPLSEMQAIP